MADAPPAQREPVAVERVEETRNEETTMTMTACECPMPEATACASRGFPEGCFYHPDEPSLAAPIVTSDVVRKLTEEARAFRRERGFIGPIVEFEQLVTMIAPRASGTRFLPQVRLDLQQFVLLATNDKVDFLCRLVELGAKHWGAAPEGVDAAQA
jgi:hypothetical protein